MVFQYFSKSLRRCFQIAKLGPKLLPNASKMLPRASQDSPQDPPKRPQERPKRLQDPVKSLQDHQNITSRGSQSSRKSPKRLQEAPKEAQELPKSLPAASHDPQKSSQKAFKMLPGDLQASLLSFSNIMLVLKPLSFDKHLNFLASKPPSLQLSRGGMRGAFE